VADLGVTCSIGLATSKSVAKVASEQDKPRGLTVVEPGCEEAFLSSLPVRALSGIGKRTQETLALYGIHTLGDLAAQDPREMERIMGVWGPRMVARARGQERSEVRAREYHEDPKSVSNERTYPRDLTTAGELSAAISQLSEKVGTRLRKRGLKGIEVTLKLKFDALHTHTAQTRLASPTDDEHAEYIRRGKLIRFAASRGFTLDEILKEFEN
jgi:DNA polymerase-4